MAEYDYPNLKLHGRLVEDAESAAAHRDSPKDSQPAPTFEIGVEIDGHFLPLFTHRSAVEVQEQIEYAKTQAASEKSSGKTSGS